LQQHGDSVAGQDGQAEVPLVDPQTQDIDARSKPVPLDLQHQDRPHPQTAGRNSVPETNLSGEIAHLQRRARPRVIGDVSLDANSYNRRR